LLTDSVLANVTRQKTGPARIGAHQSLRARLRRVLLERKNHFQKDLLRNQAPDT
jgi:hypothetical protein